MTAPLLELNGLSAGYGRSQVLHGVTLRVAAGEVVAIAGRNGAGRSTLAKAVLGLVQREGDLRFAGESIGALPTFEIARRGIAYVAEQRDLFATLSVEENLRLGVKPGATGATMRRALACAWERFPMLAERRATRAGVLSGGEQQILALARALAGEPRLLIVDEPTEGLASAAVAEVTRCLQALREAGVAVLLIEQRLALARALAARVIVLGHGRVMFDGTLDRLDTATTERWLALGE